MRHSKKLAVIGSIAIGASLTATAELTAPELTEQCEEALALSALPVRLRNSASVYTLSSDGFVLTRKSDGPFTCIVERNHEKSLIPQCADAAGVDTVIPGIMMKTKWALTGVSRDDRQERFAAMVDRGEITAPQRPGISYMMSDFNLIWNIGTESMMRIPPHVMFYAPNLLNTDIGGSFEEAMGGNRGTPYIVDEGIHGYITSLVERASDSTDVLQACKGQILAIDDPGVISSAQIAAAVAAPIRTADDLNLDESRKPIQFLRFLELKDGYQVAELNAGPGYNVRLLSTAVGDSGTVYATNADFVLELFNGLNGRLQASVDKLANVRVSLQANESLELPTLVDLAILNNNYHDLHWQNIDTAAFNSAVFAALRPGGYFVIGDHQAAAGSGVQHVSTLHRIDRDIVIAELQAAGFELVESADFLGNAEDDGSTPIFAPNIRGKTSRFLLKFQKPE